jgi:CubicO group peptidase (beta-lactamase class C family)
MERLPQLTPVGKVFAYNNAALVLAGRVIEAVTGSTYEQAVRELVLDPLGLNHSRFFSDEIVGFNVAASHLIVDGKPAVDPSIWRAPRTLNPTGGSSRAFAISCATQRSTWATVGRLTGAGC